MKLMTASGRGFRRDVAIQHIKCSFSVSQRGHYGKQCCMPNSCAALPMHSCIPSGTVCAWQPSCRRRALGFCCSAKSSSFSGAQQPAAGLQHQHHAKELMDVLAPLPLMVPVLLGVAATAVLKSAAGGAASGAGPPAWCITACLAPTVFMHIVVPGFDLLLGEQASHIKPASVPATDFTARIIPTLFVVLHLAACILAYSAAATCAAASASITTLPVAAWLLALAAGASAGIGNAAAHELIHSRNVVHQAAAQAFLIWICDWQYSRSHHHHHLHVCTPLDHAWARKGTSFWSFLPLYKLGGWRVAWEEEAAECARRGRGVWGPHNRVLAAAVGQVAVAALVWGVWGVAGLVVHLTAAAIAQFYLTAVDYLLHYGLERPPSAPGRWTPATSYSSFNSGFAVEGATLFKVLCHSDHHTTASKPFGDLGLKEALPASPNAPLSSGSQATQGGSRAAAEGHGSSQQLYQEPRLLPGVPLSVMTLVALVPPLWFKIMDPVADAANVAHVAVVGAAGTK